MAPLLALILLQNPDASTVARTYVDALAAGDLKKAAGLVQGGAYSDPAKRLAGYLAMMKDKAPIIRLIGIEAKESGDTATVTVHLMAMQKEETSDLTLSRGAEGWRILPQMVDPAKPQLLPTFTLGFVQPMVFLAIVVPIEAQKKRHDDLLAIKRVGFAMLLWTSDHDDAFPKAHADVAALIKPYLKDATLINRLHREEWLFNDALRGRSLLTLNDPAKVVMFYESEGGKGLGWGGRKLIALADGSARLADAEFLKSVRWTVKS